MSVVVAVRGKGATFLAGDSAADTSEQRFILHEKVWQPQEWLALGSVGDGVVCARIRLGTRKLLETLPCPPDGVDGDQWVYDNISRAIEDLLPERGSPDELLADFALVVCVRDQIVLVERDGTPYIEDRGYVALGAGSGYAMGYLEACGVWCDDMVDDLLAEYTRDAVETSIKFCPSVGEPVRLLRVQHG